ncbi:MAG: signal peptide peptidase SppA [Erythrobacter sp.]|nr:signal peptide peptidase SppA [Erythrobacter sp.]
MSFIGKAWKVIVGIKDGLVLIFLLLFFLALFALLSATPNPGQVREGALYIDLSGFIVEERSQIDPFAALLSREAPTMEWQARDLVRAIDNAASDDRVKAVVIDMTTFAGGGQVHLQAIGEALSRVRQAEKPVLTYALAYGDDHMQLAAHASEIWADPMGGAIITGPGGTSLYFADLLERLNVNARVYRVGEFKAAVEPFTRNSASPEASQNREALIEALWEEYQANIVKARPDLDLERVTSDPVAWLDSASGDLAEAALDADLVDKVGSRTEFGERVAEIVGEDELSELPGSFARTDFAAYLADIGSTGFGALGAGEDIAVVTVAGTIVDGDAGPGTAGGARIASLLDEALSDESIKGLVVRVDSPGGSATASEEIRRAILRYRAKDVPVAISFANVAASGGYWVASAGDRIFAQPETITGSIGVFAVLPTFEEAAAEIGVSADGYRTTPLSGQPDLIAGLTPEMDAVFQSSVTATYRDFLDRVADSRGLSEARLDQIAQGRVWDGGSARQLGLVDQFGGLGEALAWVAGEAGLEDETWKPRFLGEATNDYNSLIRQLLTSDAKLAGSPRNGGDLFAMAAAQREASLERLARDATMLAGTRGIQAYCLECPSAPRAGEVGTARDLMALARRFLLD